ncbi:DUF6114 domain-containing protein [Streptomyces sp. NPDC007883]|uniref:DUF6114 domain-containing protein n=1 Tax=Streptomyces sp. NPDC007883 TaxID=3155116 RepID=UPI0033FECB47
MFLTSGRPGAASRLALSSVSRARVLLGAVGAVRPPRRSDVVDARRRFRAWRGGRPFWAGLFTLGAGLPIIYLPYVPLSLSGVPLALSTTAGAGALLTGTLLVVLGISLWFRPQTRVFAGITALLLSLVSFPVANFGGLFLGLFAGMIGGSLALAWAAPEESVCVARRAPDGPGPSARSSEVREPS